VVYVNYVPRRDRDRDRNRAPLGGGVRCAFACDPRDLPVRAPIFHTEIPRARGLGARRTRRFRRRARGSAVDGKRACPLPLRRGAGGTWRIFRGTGAARPGGAGLLRAAARVVRVQGARVADLRSGGEAAAAERRRPVEVMRQEGRSMPRPSKGREWRTCVEAVRSRVPADYGVRVRGSPRAPERGARETLRGLGTRREAGPPRDLDVSGVHAGLGPSRLM